MSSIVISGDTSGAITLAAPSVAGTNTATLPAAAGTVMVSGNMPTFSYYQSSAQTLSTGVATKLTFTSSDWDTTGGMYSSSRFTPTVAGYYQINCGFQAASSVDNQLYIYKNGSVFYQGQESTTAGSSLSSLVYCNGSTDYIEIYAYVGTTGTCATGATKTWFNGCLMRSA